MSKYFITGGAGFLGINLTRYLLDKGHTVVSYDFAEKYDYPEKNLDTVKVIQGDIRDIVVIKSWPLTVNSNNHRILIAYITLYSNCFYNTKYIILASLT
jgi:nucleoside-diphosphate-sugar epimerase